MQVTASLERPKTTSHAEFVQDYRGGRIALTWADGLPAYTFAAWGRWFIGYLQLLVGTSVGFCSLCHSDIRSSRSLAPFGDSRSLSWNNSRRAGP